MDGWSTIEFTSKNYAFFNEFLQWSKYKQQKNHWKMKQLYLKKYIKMFLKGLSGCCKVSFHPAAIFQEDKAVRFNKELNK